MKRKSLTVKNKVHKKILGHLNNKEFKKIYKKFDEFLGTNKDTIYQNKLILKKRIKKFSMYQHYKKLSEIIN